MAAPTYRAENHGYASDHNNLTISITAAGDNRCVFACIVTTAGGTVSSCKYDGNNMTLVASYTFISNWTMYLYRYVGASTSSKNIVVQWAGGDYNNCLGYVFATDNTDQTSPVDVYDSIETSEVTCNSQSGVMSKQVTTGYANSLVFAFIKASGSGTFTPGSGQTEIVDSQNGSISYKATTTAGNVTMTETISSCSGNRLLVFAVKEVQSTAYTMAVSAGSYSLTGQNVSFSKTLHLIASVTDYVLSGVNINLSWGRRLICQVGNYVLTGQDILIHRTIHMAVAVGDYILTGININLNRGKTMMCQVGNYIVTGIDIEIHKGLNMAVSVGEYILTGIDVNLSRGYHLIVEPGAYVLTGVAVNLKKAWNMVVEAGAYVLTGKNINLSRGYHLITEAGNYVLTGIDITLTRGIHLIVSAGSYILTGVNVIMGGIGSWKIINQSRNNSSVTNQTKHDSTVSNLAKNMATFINLMKH